MTRGNATCSWWIVLFLLAATPSTCGGFLSGPRFIHTPTLLRSTVDNDDSVNRHEGDGAVRIYFDIQVQDTPVGRLVFELPEPSPLPLHTENIIQLCKGSRRGIDPLAHYVGCEFDYSPATIEDGSGRYRWGHILKGRGRNAIGRADEPIVDHEHLLACTHTCFGGQYYGVKYEVDDATSSKNDNNNDDDDNVRQSGVVLAVSIAGPGRGSSRLSILRVGESPPEWRERLLLNSGVVGFLLPESIDTLRTMARQRLGPPKVVASGVL